MNSDGDTVKLGTKNASSSATPIAINRPSTRWPRRTRWVNGQTLYANGGAI